MTTFPVPCLGRRQAVNWQLTADKKQQLPQSSQKGFQLCENPLPPPSTLCQSAGWQEVESFSHGETPPSSCRMRIAPFPCLPLGRPTESSGVEGHSAVAARLLELYHAAQQTVSPYPAPDLLKSMQGVTEAFCHGGKAQKALLPFYDTLLCPTLFWANLEQ